MKYLIVMDGEPSELEGTGLTNDILEQAYNGDLLIIRFEGGRFETPLINSEDVPDDEDNEDGDTHEEFDISKWESV